MQPPPIPTLRYVVCVKCDRLNAYWKHELEEVIVDDNVLIKIVCRCGAETGMSRRYLSNTKNAAYSIALGYQRSLTEKANDQIIMLEEDILCIHFDKDQIVPIFNSVIFCIRKHFEDIPKFIKEKDYKSALKECKEAIKYLDKEYICHSGKN